MKIKIIAGLAKIVWTRYEKYRAEIMFYDGPKKVFWLSRKQGRKLNSCAKDMNINSCKRKGDVIVVLDGDRFVWCGCIMNSLYDDNEDGDFVDDLPFLKKHFKVKDEDVNLSSCCTPPCLEVPEVVEVDKELMDVA